MFFKSLLAFLILDNLAYIHRLQILMYSFIIPVLVAVAVPYLGLKICWNFLSIRNELIVNILNKEAISTLYGTGRTSSES